MKKKKWLVAFLVVALLVFVGMGWFFNRPISRFKAIHLIPEDAIYLVETTRPIENWQTLRTANLWKHLRKNAFFAELTESANALDTLVQENATLFSMLGSRQLLASAHMYSPTDYDFLFVVDLDQASQIGGWETLFKSFVGDLYQVTAREYMGYEILELTDRQTRETLHLSIVENLLVGSYTHKLIEKSLAQIGLPELGRNLAFQEVEQKVAGKEMIRFYFNYDLLDDYLNLFLEEPNPYLKDISSWLHFSGLGLSIDKNSNISAQGLTNVNDSINSYLLAMIRSGKGKVTIPKVAPQRTAFMLHLGFDSFLEMYEEFSTTAKSELSDYQAYQDNLRKMENYLKVDLKEHFFSWIDDEAAIIQTVPTRKGEPFELAFVLKATSIENANEKLEYLSKQIRKKTPVKFRQVDYKGYPIRFLSVKGFFKALIGKLFSGIEKPYYTSIDDYVIFSNDPRTLKGLIDDYGEGRVLANDRGFQEFNGEFSGKSNVFLYAHTPLLYGSAIKALSAESKDLLKTNQPYIVCFSRIGFQLEKRGNAFSTNVQIGYEPADRAIAKLDQIEKEVDNLYQIAGVGPFPEKTQLQKFEEELVDVTAISPDDLDTDLYTEKFESGAIHFEVSMKDGLKHGNYREYFESGELRVKGKFKEDLKTGSWRTYNREGELIEKQRWKAGKQN